MAIPLRAFETSADPLRVLMVTRIFPNQVEPMTCAFQRQQLAALARRCDVTVLAAIPYLPGASFFARGSRVARLARVPREDVIDGIRVLHPRIGFVPHGGSAFAAANAPLYAASLLPYVPRLRGRFDIVLGAFLYPDACAAAALAKILDLPYAVKVHGTDVNVVARWRTIRPLIRATLRGAALTVAVSRPMLDALVALGAAPASAELVRNGVDRSLFRPSDKLQARRELGLTAAGQWICFVGDLTNEKGVPELVAALRTLPPSTRLVLVGEGPLRASLEAERSELGDRLVLAGTRPLGEVARYLAACDVSALPSWAEGTPNVVLEALAAGRPVVATSVGGIPDVVTPRETGLLVPPRDVPALARALAEALGRSWDEEALVAAAPPSWDDSGAHLFAALEAVVAGELPPAEAPRGRRGEAPPTSGRSPSSRGRAPAQRPAGL